jgi:hypothetical protein
MGESPHFWLDVTNIVLGAVVLVCVLATVFAVAWEVAARVKRRCTLSAELDRDMRHLFRGARPGGGAR